MFKADAKLMDRSVSFSAVLNSLFLLEILATSDTRPSFTGTSKADAGPGKLKIGSP
jgi:hypothetical protein